MVRLAGRDGDAVKVFLVSTSAKDAQRLHSALQKRVDALKEEAPSPEKKGKEGNDD